MFNAFLIWTNSSWCTILVYNSGSSITMSAAERFCPVTEKFKTDVTLNQPHKAPFREADLYKG